MKILVVLLKGDVYVSYLVYLDVVGTTLCGRIRLYNRTRSRRKPVSNRPYAGSIYYCYRLCRPTCGVLPP